MMIAIGNILVLGNSSGPSRQPVRLAAPLLAGAEAAADLASGLLAATKGHVGLGLGSLFTEALCSVSTLMG